jgi:hypothetical protein
MMVEGMSLGFYDLELHATESERVWKWLCLEWFWRSPENFSVKLKFLSLWGGEEWECDGWCKHLDPKFFLQEPCISHMVFMVVRDENPFS